MASRLGKIAAKSSGLFICDMQEQFRKTISFYPQIIEVARRMLIGAKTLDIPVIVTEQYPKGQISDITQLSLGPTPITHPHHSCERPVMTDSSTKVR